MYAGCRTHNSVASITGSQIGLAMASRSPYSFRPTYIRSRFKTGKG